MPARENRPTQPHRPHPPLRVTPHRTVDIPSPAQSNPLRRCPPEPSPSAAREPDNKPRPSPASSSPPARTSTIRRPGSRRAHPGHPLPRRHYFPFRTVWASEAAWREVHAGLVDQKQARRERMRGEGTQGSQGSQGTSSNVGPLPCARGNGSYRDNGTHCQINRSGPDLTCHRPCDHRHGRTRTPLREAVLH